MVSVGSFLYEPLLEPPLLRHCALPNVPFGRLLQEHPIATFTEGDREFDHRQTRCLDDAALTLGAGTWVLDLSATAQTLADDTYDVTATQTDIAGNSTSDATTDVVLVDTDAPTAPTVNTLVSDQSQPTITGTYDASDLGPDDADFCVSIDGVTYCLDDAALTLDGGAGTWALDLSATAQTLADDTCDVTA